MSTYPPGRLARSKKYQMILKINVTEHELLSYSRVEKLSGFVLTTTDQVIKLCIEDGDTTCKTGYYLVFQGKSYRAERYDQIIPQICDTRVTAVSWAPPEEKEDWENFENRVHHKAIKLSTESTPIYLVVWWEIKEQPQRILYAQFNRGRHVLRV